MSTEEAPTPRPTPATANDEDLRPAEVDAPAEVNPEDFYMDGPYLVFTAAFHLRRGYCCNSDCRHCPFK